MGGPFAKNKDADGAKMKDYYSILEVAEGADAQEIKKAYRKLAKLYHPDIVKDDAAKVRRMYEIQEAYECLKDAESRKRYDEKRKANNSSAQRNTAFSHQGKSTQSQPSYANDFERFFGFSPKNQTKTNQQKILNKNQQGPICLEQMFAQFFGAAGKRKGRQKV